MSGATRTDKKRASLHLTVGGRLWWQACVIDQLATFRTFDMEREAFRTSAGAGLHELPIAFPPSYRHAKPATTRHLPLARSPMRCMPMV